MTPQRPKMRQRVEAVRHNYAPDWFTIRPAAKADDDGDGPATAKIYIYAMIGDSFWDDTIAASEFVDALAEVEADEIEAHINSPGGDVWDAVAIANALRQHPAHVTTFVDGVAASAASIIAIAGDDVVMSPGGTMMIHDASGICMGQAADMHDCGDWLDHISDNMANQYARKGGGSADDWRALMRLETWYNDGEAVKAGLADRVGEAITADADAPAMARMEYDLRIWEHPGRDHAPAPKFVDRSRAVAASGIRAEGRSHNPRKDPHMTDLNSGLRQRLGIADDVELDEDGLLSALDDALAPPPEDQTPPVPAGSVVVEQATLDALRQGAAEGAQARAQQLRERRETLVTAAIHDGRIMPSRKDHWLHALSPESGDPEGNAQALASLAPGLVPVEAAGYQGGLEQTESDQIWNSLGLDKYVAQFGSEG